jgi:UDP-N-acetyl-D-galactosamine dehydrogenase
MLRDRRISVMGLGYVGLPVAVAFGKQQEVIAFDISRERIEQLKQGLDKTKEVTLEELRSAELCLTSDPNDLQRANFHIVAVPTPIDDSNQPDLTPLIRVSELLGSVIQAGDIVVYESTVYPGVTEEVCMPILEQVSGLQGGRDFFVGYSPERINPGDKNHTFTKIKKIVSGQTPEVLAIIAEVYSSVVEAGVYPARSIRVAEAAKVIENTQRDINIAFVNELAIIFHKMGISVHEVLDAAKTKWNFLPFEPGLVGGHCIGVDPYYLTHKAQQLGFHPEVILAGRRINDGMGKYVAERVIKAMIQQDLPIRAHRVAILGFTFKENCPDVRNTKVMDIIQELRSYQIEPVVYDPVADRDMSKHEYGIHLCTLDEAQACDVVVMAVAHQEFCDEKFVRLFDDARVILDVKNVLGDRAGVVKL